jgi:hypothetical protein
MLPKKLKDDSITEALLEIRFTSSDLDEVVVGRLSDFSGWEAYSKQRMSATHPQNGCHPSDSTAS